MIQIYHNPRCSKSRQAIAFLEEKGLTFETILYLNNTPNKEDIRLILKKLGITAKELIRTKEEVWKSEYKDQILSEDQLIEILVKHPKLIERPIVIKDNKAVIARPTEKIQGII